MNEKELDRIVDALRARSVPEQRPGLEDRVLRRIRHAEPADLSVWERLQQSLLRPGIALAAFGAATAASVATVVLFSPPPEIPTTELARAALGFDSFENPINLPSDQP